MLSVRQDGELVGRVRLQGGHVHLVTRGTAAGNALSGGLQENEILRIRIRILFAKN